MDAPPGPAAGRHCRHAQPARQRHLALPAPARGQPGRLVGVGGRGVRGGARGATCRCCSRSGYAACHWCHVMAHESFEDDGTAAQLNARLRGIKVDREERPDVDAVYMAATQAMTGPGRLADDRASSPRRASRSTAAPTSRPRRASAGSLRQLLTHGLARRRRGVRGGGRGRSRHARRRRGGRPAARGRRRRRPGRRRDNLREGFDAGARRVRRRPEVPAVDGRWSSCCATTSARARPTRWRWPADLRADGPRRDLRPARRRLRPLQRRRALGGAALREDALRQRAAAARSTRTCTGSPARRSPCAWPTRRPAFLLRDLRTAEGGFAVRARRRHRRRRGHDLRLDPRPARRRARRRRTAPGPRELLTVTARRHVRARRLDAAAAGDPADPDALGARAGRAAGRARRAAAARRATTRWSRPGTGWRSSRSPRPAPRCDRPSGSPPPRGPPTCCWTSTSSTAACAASSRDGVVGAAAGVLEDHGALADGLLALHQATGDAAVARGRDASCSTWRSRTSPTATAASTTPPTTPRRWCTGPARSPTTRRRRRLRAGRGAAHGVGADRPTAARYREAAEAALHGAGTLLREHPRFAGHWLTAAEAQVAGPLQVAIAGDGPDLLDRARRHAPPAAPWSSPDPRTRPACRCWPPGRSSTAPPRPTCAAASCASAPSPRPTRWPPRFARGERPRPQYRCNLVIEGSRRRRTR